MKRKTILATLTCLTILASVVTDVNAQSKNTNAELTPLFKIISRNITIPSAVKDNKAAVAFSMKFILGTNNKTEKVILSIHTPNSIGKKILNTNLYNGISWKSILNKEPSPGDIIVLPIIIYPGDIVESFPTFSFSDVKNLLSFQDSKPSSNITLLQIFTIPEIDAVK